MSTQLALFFNPRGVAVIGASSDPGKLGYAVARNLIEGGYQGAIQLVNQKGGTLFGRTMVTSIQAIPDPVDLAIVIVPAPAAAQSLRELGQRGLRAAILTSGGFRETGPEGAQLEAEVLAVCKEYDLRLIGPNCVGLIDTHLPLDTTFLPPPLPAPGHLAFLSHSGAFCAAVIDWSRTQGFSFSRIVSLGNQADLTETDLLPAVANDPHTKTICLYLETISNGQKFLETSRQNTFQKPIVALKVGRTAAGQKAAASHTGALASSETALNAAFERAGVFRAATAEQMFDWAQALSTCPLPNGKKMAILTTAGGPGVIAADALEAEGLSLSTFSPETESRLKGLLPAAASPHNPVDMLASAGPREYAGCLEILLAAPEVDGVLVLTQAPPSHRAEAVAEALIPLIQASQKPVLVAQLGGQLTAAAFEYFIKAQIPVYPFPERAASALGVLSRRTIFLQAASATKAEMARPKPELLHTESAEELVAAYDIPTAPLKLAANADEAAGLAIEMGFPLVAKIASPDILHKSDLSGVLLNLDSVEAVVTGYTTLMERAKAARPAARLEGITLQRQISGGQEVIIGAVRDPQFGPLMMFGSGGVEAEGLKDVAFALAPLNQAEAESMLQKTWAGKKLNGFRSLQAVDREAVIEALIHLSWLVSEHPEISEIEINPLRALSQGVVAIDIRMKME